MLLSHLWEYASEWPYESNSVSIRNDRKKFITVPKHYQGLGKTISLFICLVDSLRPINNLSVKQEWVFLG